MIIFLLAYPLILFLVHMISLRLSRKPILSRQKHLGQIILILNGIFVTIGTGVFKAEGIFIILYGFIVINAFAYAYFHFFNMSETARRIKLLVNIRKNTIINPQDIKENYSHDRSLKIRIKRLKQWSQITEESTGHYILKGRLLYIIANWVFCFRVLLGFENEPPN